MRLDVLFSDDEDGGKQYTDSDTNLTDTNEVVSIACTKKERL